MVIDKKEELMNHVKNIHELSYNHYAWAKEFSLETGFPRFTCGSSSRNLSLTLMEKGYLNSSFLYNSKRDHAYVVLPFVFGKDSEKGFIVIDPTSDQLFNDKKNAPRNNLFVVFGDRWKYKTDWKQGADLFPSSQDESTFSNLDTLRRDLESPIYERSLGLLIRDQKGVDNYFKTVFENPINVDVEYL